MAEGISPGRLPEQTLLHLHLMPTRSACHYVTNTGSDIARYKHRLTSELTGAGHTHLVMCLTPAYVIGLLSLASLSRIFCKKTTNHSYDNHHHGKCNCVIRPPGRGPSFSPRARQAPPPASSSWPPARQTVPLATACTGGKR